MPLNVCSRWQLENSRAQEKPPSGTVFDSYTQMSCKCCCGAAFLNWLVATHRGLQGCFHWVAASCTVLRVFVFVLFFTKKHYEKHMFAEKMFTGHRSPFKVSHIYHKSGSATIKNWICRSRAHGAISYSALLPITIL